MPFRKFNAPVIRLLVLFIFLTILPGFTSPCAADSDLISIYAWEPWDPYQMENESGQLTGLDIEIVEAILKKTGEPYEWRSTPWKRVIKDIKEGYLDAGLGASITEERKKWALFSVPYRKESVVLFIQKGKQKDYKFKTLEDIIGSNVIIGVTRGYYYGDDYERLIKNEKFAARFEEVKLNENNYRKLEKGRIDGFLADPVSGTAGLKAMGILDRVEIHPMKVFSNDIHVIFSKKRVSPSYVQTFNQGIQQLKTSGEHAKILNKYLGK